MTVALITLEEALQLPSVAEFTAKTGRQFPCVSQVDRLANGETVSLYSRDKVEAEVRREMEYAARMLQANQGCIYVRDCK